MTSDKRNVIVTPRVLPSAVEDLHTKLTRIDAAYTSEVRLKSDLDKVLDLVQFQKTQTIITLYSFDLVKCNNPS